MTDKIEGRNPVAEALKSGRPIDKIYIKKGSRKGSVIPILAKARQVGISVVETDARKLDEMSETGAHQGIIAMCAAAEYAQLEDIFKNAERKGESRLSLFLTGFVTRIISARL